MIGMSSYWNNVMIGLVILLGVTMSAIQRNLQVRRRVANLTSPIIYAPLPELPSRLDWL